MSSGTVRITNYLRAADTTSTLDAMRALGASVTVDERSGEVVVRGVGLDGAREPGAAVDVGNAGTLMRLLPGWLAAQEGRAFQLDGDASIRRRPVDRIASPLREMGAVIEATDERFPPFFVRGTPLAAITYVLPVASAQVKSCVLIAGLRADRHDDRDRARAQPRPQFVAGSPPPISPRIDNPGHTYGTSLAPVFDFRDSNSRPTMQLISGLFTMDPANISSFHQRQILAVWNTPSPADYKMLHSDNTPLPYYEYDLVAGYINVSTDGN